MTAHAGADQQSIPEPSQGHTESEILTFDVDDNYVLVQCPKATLSPLEKLLFLNPPILESLLLQVPTRTIFQLYHTSSKLRKFLRTYPTVWKYLSFRLPQPTAVQQRTPGSSGDNSSTPTTRISPNYGVDQLVINIVNPFSKNLASLELDNTAVSGSILLSTVLNLRRETLQHLSVRGCKNVSLKYHIVDWLKGFWTASDPDAPLSASFHPAQEFKKLALKSLYTYRCRHHRRRPYLPNSLDRRDSDSEPTHDIVDLCHKLAIWTDTAWCTTPGARCYRRRGYVTMRVPQDPREVWVVYDRLWRSKNWLGPLDETESRALAGTSKRERDGRSWEQDEAASVGEPLGTGVVKKPYGEGKPVPAHSRSSHREFVEDVKCDNCSAVILERCEQCSVLMHCMGCRKTLCASCAYDRPYTRNRRSLGDGEEGDKYWWAPGCLVSPCAMQDQDDVSATAGLNPPPTGTSLTPNLKFKWCCTEPVFSGGGGITFGPGVITKDVERVRASPLPKDTGWEDPEFQISPSRNQMTLSASARLPDPRTGIPKDDPQDTLASLLGVEAQPAQVPRNLCDECYKSRNWKIHCKSCNAPLCLEHDFRGLRTKICGFKDLRAEKEALKAISKQKTFRDLANQLRRLHMESSHQRPSGQQRSHLQRRFNAVMVIAASPEAEPAEQLSSSVQPESGMNVDGHAPEIDNPSPLHQPTATYETLHRPSPLAQPDRPITPDSNATASPSRESSPAPSNGSSPSIDDTARDPPAPVEEETPPPRWTGCYSFLCPQYRAVGDHRRRCTAISKECLECKVLVCGQCVESMEPACTCQKCSPADASSTSSGDSDNLPFWCPNCRRERLRDGRCERNIDRQARIDAAQALQVRYDNAQSTATPNADSSAVEEAVDGLRTSMNRTFGLGGLEIGAVTSPFMTADELWLQARAMMQRAEETQSAPVVEDVD